MLAWGCACKILRKCNQRGHFPALAGGRPAVLGTVSWGRSGVPPCPSGLRDRSAREGFADSAITSFRDSRKSRTRTKSCNSGTNHLADAVSNRKKCEAEARAGCRSNSGTVADIDREGIPVQHIAPAKSERLAPAKSERPALAGVQLPSMGRKTPPQRPPRSSLPDLARCAPKPSVFSRYICAV